MRFTRFLPLVAALWALPAQASLIPTPAPVPYAFAPGQHAISAQFNANNAQFNANANAIASALNSCSFIPGSAISAVTAVAPITYTVSACDPGVGETLTLGFNGTFANAVTFQNSITTLPGFLDLFQSPATFTNVVHLNNNVFSPATIQAAIFTTPGEDNSVQNGGTPYTMIFDAASARAGASKPSSHLDRSESESPINNIASPAGACTTQATVQWTTNYELKPAIIVGMNPPLLGATVGVANIFPGNALGSAPHGHFDIVLCNNTASTITAGSTYFPWISEGY